MTARKTRPMRGANIPEEVFGAMSWRDRAAVVGITTAQMSRWMRLGALPDAEFERRVELLKGNGELVSCTRVLDEPVSARGRVARALAIYKSMTVDERAAFEHRIGPGVSP